MSATLWAVDWGTSSFRLALLDHQGQVLKQMHSAAGVTKLLPEAMGVFLAGEMANLDRDARDLPVILCGMVGSTLGWQLVPYADCPVQPTSLARHLAPLAGWAQPGWLVPGLQCRNVLGEPDVMRGEETQIVGWLAQASATQQAHALLCLPGTHAKWVHIVDGQVQNFTTALTGELYALLAEHSVLVEGEQQPHDAAFDQGVQLARQSPHALLNLFATRARVMTGELQSPHSASFLSGLLLGLELSSALQVFGERQGPVHLIGGTALAGRYARALASWSQETVLHSGEELVFRGLFELFSKRQHD